LISAAANIAEDLSTGRASPVRVSNPIPPYCGAECIDRRACRSPFLPPVLTAVSSAATTKAANAIAIRASSPNGRRYRVRRRVGRSTTQQFPYERARLFLHDAAASCGRRPVNGNDCREFKLRRPFQQEASFPASASRRQLSLVGDHVLVHSVKQRFPGDCELARGLGLIPVGVA